MAGDRHESAIPLGIESVVEHIGELEVVLGPAVRPALDRVRARLIEAMAARDSGEEATAVARIGDAMEELNHLADGLDLAEAALMRAVTQSFRIALSRGDTSEARLRADAMLRHSGATPLKKG